jgi:DNA polymerase-3 subunit alpha
VGRPPAARWPTRLWITDLDPIKYDLLFERFLNPSRISMPDIDMDFDSRYRDEMIRYAAERYGRDHVAQIVTFSTIKARAAVRDAARVLGYPYGVGDKVAKAMPPLVMGRDTPLYACLEQHPKFADGYKMAADLREMYETDPDVKKVIDVAKGLEGLRRQDGIHAAAVVITKDPLTDLPADPAQARGGPAHRDGAGRHPVRDARRRVAGPAEDGLPGPAQPRRHLRHVGDHQRSAASSSTSTTSRSTTPAHLELLGRGDTIGVFQLEGGADAGAHAVARARQVRGRRRPRGALPAGPDGGEHAQRLRRPRTAGKPVEYFHPDAEEVLADTYGLMIYQESVMRVAQKFAGYSLAEADNLRKAMRQEEPRGDGQGAGRRSRTGARPPATARARHRPVRHHREVRRLRLQQEPQLRLRPGHLPDRLPQGALPGRVPGLSAHQREEQPRQGGGVPVRLPGDGHQGAHPRHQPVEVPADVCCPIGSPGAITFGLSADPQRGRGLVEQLLAERDANGPFASFHDFVERVPEPVLNKRTVESLIKAGAFDGFGLAAQGPADGVRADHRHHARASPRTRPGRDEPVRRSTSRRPTTPGGFQRAGRRSPRSSSTRPSA